MSGSADKECRSAIRAAADHGWGCVQDEKPDPTVFTLDEWLRMHGTRTGTFTHNGVTYTDMNEVEWRQANNVWASPGVS